MSNQYTWLADANPTLTAAQLAVLAATPVALRKMSLEQFFAAVVGAGGATGELAKLWPYQQFVIWANEGLNAGDYQRVLALLATIPVTLDEATQTAITSVLGAATLTNGDQANATMGMTPVTDWTAATIAAALDAAAYEYVDGRWVAPELPELEFPV